MSPSFLRELEQYIAIPSVSTQPQHKGDCVKAAAWMARKLASLGAKTKLVSTGGHPLVYGRLVTDNKAPHIVIYGHSDVQPEDPIKLWKTPPFKMTKIGGKLFARGVTDNKGPTLALVIGLQQALKKGAKVNLSFLIEGEEEIGSRHLPQTLKKLKKTIGKVDAILLSDTGIIDADHFLVTTGVRGILALELTLRGLKADLHSGHGGPIPNAARELSRVMAGLYDSEGWVNIPGFYDGVGYPLPKELADINRALSKREFLGKIGGKDCYPLDGENPFVANRFYPSLEINGLTSGYQGPGGKTIIPAAASAKITCRIAPGQEALAFEKNVIGEIKKRINQRLFGFDVRTRENAVDAYATILPHLEEPAKKQTATEKTFAGIFKKIDKSVDAVTGRPPVYLREGASIPILSGLKKILGADSIMLGMIAEDSLLHSPNENISLRVLENGIRVFEEFFKQIH